MGQPATAAIYRGFWRAFAHDPRHYQIAVLTSLLAYGVFRLDFDVGAPEIVGILVTALTTQHLCAKLFRFPVFDPRSPLISGLSLCLLLRANEPIWLFIGASLAVTSKFVFQWRGKHVFNPTNFAIVMMIACTGEAWVSPGQWGSPATVAFAFACLGGLVIHRAARSDVTLAFLISFAVILFGRAYWLGDPWAIPLKQLQNGALLLFAFFMISDPKTTPDSRAGRILFALLVAAGAAYVQFVLYRTNGPLWSLLFVSLATPAFDLWLPGTKYRWHRLTPASIYEGESHEKNPDLSRDAVRPAVPNSAGA